VDSGRSDDGDFVATPICCRSQYRAKNYAGILVRSGIGAASGDHFVRGLQKLRNVQAHDSRWNHAEVRKGRVSAANARNTRINLPEFVCFGDLLHLGAGIRDRDEVAADLVRAYLRFHTFEEVLLEDIWLECAAGFARNDAERLFEVELLFDGFDL